MIEKEERRAFVTVTSTGFIFMINMKHVIKEFQCYASFEWLIASTKRPTIVDDVFKICITKAVAEMLIVVLGTVGGGEPASTS